MAVLAIDGAFMVWWAMHVVTEDCQGRHALDRADTAGVAVPLGALISSGALFLLLIAIALRR